MKTSMKQSIQANILSTLSLILILSAVAASLFTAKFNTELDTARDNRFALIYQANNFQAASQHLTDQVRKYSVTGESEYFDNYWKEVNTTKGREQAREAMSTIGLTANEQAMVDEMGSISNNLVPIEEAAMNFVQVNDIEGAKTLLYSGEYNDGIVKIGVIMDQFFDSITDRSNEQIADLSRRANIFTVFSLFSFFIVFLIQIMVILFVRYKLIKPIVAVKDNLVHLSNGDLSDKLKMEENTSEVGTLVVAIHKTNDFLSEIISDVNDQLNAMASGNFRIDTKCENNYIGDFKNILTAVRTINYGLSNALNEINVASDQVSVGSDQVSMAAQGLSQGATEQAAAIEELSATISEITEKIKSNASDASKAASVSDDAGNGIAKSNVYMHELIAAMQNITNSASEIGKIIKTIDDIAFQTNILALNAAVEAARAGVAGKGFAVVADEVRNLASKSAEAAKSTTGLIESAITAVNDGTQIASRTADALNMVVDKVENVNKYIRLISTASDEQANGASQVVLGVDQISSVIQTNSATAEESAAASEELSAQANMLKSLVAKFKLRQS